MPSFAPSLALALPLLLLLPACKDESPQAGHQAPTPEVSVLTLHAEPLTLQEELPARVTAVRVAQVRPQVSGIIRKREFTEGETVKAGETLYQIDTAPFRAEVAAASASVERAKAVLSQAEIDERRTKTLLDTGAATQAAMDQATAGLALAKAELAQARAALTRNQLSLRYSTISAPIAGQIGISRVSEGTLVGPADPEPLAVIQQIDQVYVDIKQPADRGPAIGPTEGPVEVTLVSSSGEPFEERGTVLFTDITVDPGTGESTVRALVPNPKGALLPGMYVRARIASAPVAEAILVPQQAIQRLPTGDAQVLVVKEDSTVEMRPVTIGRTVGTQVWIADGLAAGERVVVEGQGRLATGATVSAVDWQAPETKASH